MSQTDKPKLYSTYAGFLRDFRDGYATFLASQKELLETALTVGVVKRGEADKALQEVAAEMARITAPPEGVVFLDEWKSFIKVRKKQPGNRGGF